MQRLSLFPLLLAACLANCIDISAEESDSSKERALTAIKGLGSQITFDQDNPERPPIEIRIYGCRGKDEHLVHL
jgi:hypothetical protein